MPEQPLTGSGGKAHYHPSSDLGECLVDGHLKSA